MPYFRLETTADLPENADVPEILEDLCEALSSRPSVEPSRTRGYHVLRSVWQMGAGAAPGFAHLTVFVHEGRDATWKGEMADALLAVLKSRFAASLEVHDVAVTVDVREMDKASYRRSEEP